MKFSESDQSRTNSGSAERRKHPREDVDHPCWLRTDSSSHLAPARISNFSKGGARVSYVSHIQIPDKLDLLMTEDGKVGLIASVTDDLVKKGLHAGKLVGQVAKVVGGGGGGKPTMAQAGGKEPAKLAEALQLAKKLAGEQLAK